MIRFLIDIYIFILVSDVILSYFPQYRYKNWAMHIKKVSDFTCNPVRKLLPPDLPFDFSPMVVIIFLKLIEALW